MEVIVAAERAVAEATEGAVAEVAEGAVVEARSIMAIIISDGTRNTVGAALEASLPMGSIAPIGPRRRRFAAWNDI